MVSGFMKAVRLMLLKVPLTVGPIGGARGATTMRLGYRRKLFFVVVFAPLTLQMTIAFIRKFSFSAWTPNRAVIDLQHQFPPKTADIPKEIFMIVLSYDHYGRVVFVSASIV